MATKLNLGVDDLTKTALKRLVAELLAASEGEEQKILESLSQRKRADKEQNDLADLVEEKRGKANAIDPMDDEEDGEEDDLAPKKRGVA